MDSITFVVGVLAVLLLGLAAGALLAEACVLVVMWRSQDPASFLSWYREHADLLLKFFGPLEVASTVAILAATGLTLAGGSSGTKFYIVSTALNLAVLASFPLYFKNANASFATGSIPVSRVPTELARWSKWHWARTGLAITAFLLAVIGVAHQAYVPAA
jgi:hypothetical protein